MSYMGESVVVKLKFRVESRRHKKLTHGFMPWNRILKTGPLPSHRLGAARPEP